jgi:hypothetical protein
MGSVAKTANLNLPQFDDNDKPSWMGDINAAFASIEADHVARVARENDLQAQIVTLQNRVTDLESA